MRLLMLAEARTVHARRWATALLRRGWQVAMLSVSTAEIPGVQIIPLGTPAFGPRYPRRWWGRYAQYVRSVIRRLSPDLVHIHFLTDYPVAGFPGHGPGGSLWGGDAGPPVVISTWGADVVQDEWVPGDTPGQRARKIQLLQAADAVTATTSFLADCTAEYGGIGREAITVIPFGVDVSRYTAGTPRFGREDLTVGFIKHLEPKYGFEYLLRALPGVFTRFPGARLVVVGAGSRQEQMRRLAGELGVAARVDWRGAVEHPQVPAALAEMDVYAMPSVSLSETFGVSAVEAQAAGVPVVFTDLPGVREAVTDGVGGLAVPPQDPAALEQAICRLLADESLRRRLGDQGRRVVFERFDFERNVDQMEAVYRQVSPAVACAAS